MSEPSLKIDSLFNVQGKVALVTGASRGIGEMIASGLVQNGVRTYITARKAEDCQNTAEALSAHGECIALPCDISDMSDMDRLCAELREREERLDILVNNAGTSWGAAIEDFPETGWDKTVDLNLKSPFFLIQKLLPLLKSAGSADDPSRIVNIASIDGMFISHGSHFPYPASKAGLIHLTRHLADRLAASHITVNSIAPGYFETKMTAHVESDEFVQGIPMKRSGQAPDAAGAVIFLSSQAGAWLTGINIPVDGGSFGCNSSATTN